MLWFGLALLSASTISFASNKITQFHLCNLASDAKKIDNVKLPLTSHEYPQ